MPRAVRFAEYGDVNVLQVVEVERPEAGRSEVLVEVVATSINPGEAKIRDGSLHERWPATFPSGQGSDLAGRVAAVGPGVTTFAPGDEVFGFTDGRAAQADFVVVAQSQLTIKPPGVSFEVAGALFVAGTTAFAAVRAVDLHRGETVVVSGAAGGVGSLAVQLALRTGAAVIAVAGAANQEWLRSLGATPVVYGDGLIDRLRAAAPAGLDALIDTHGSGYVQLAIDLGITAPRIDTIADFAAMAKFGVKGDGSAAAANVGVLAELAGLVACGELVVPIARTYPLDQVREAYADLASGHTRGKIVLLTAA